MRIVVIGGTGLIGTQLVSQLGRLGHEVLAASPTSGFDSTNGEGLMEALSSFDVVVDVSNSPSYEEQGAMDFFQTSGHNIIDAAEGAGIMHHIALSMVGTEHLGSGYFRAKKTQERIIRESRVPYTIVQSTPFFEYLDRIANWGDQSGKVHLSPAYVQPIAAKDVAEMMVPIILGQPMRHTVEIAGPERFRLTDLVQVYLDRNKDKRIVIPDAQATYLGAALQDESLVPGMNPRLGKTDFEQWFSARLKSV